VHKTEITTFLEVKTKYNWKVWRKGESRNSYIKG